MSILSFFRLNCRKSHKPIGRSFTIEVFECLLKKACDASYVNLQGVQLLEEMGILVSAFFIFHVSLSKLGKLCKFGLYEDLYLNLDMHL
jgi:hypothetical protein